MAFRIEFFRPAHEHLKALRRRDRQTLIEAIAVRLSHQSAKPTRQRKKPEDNDLAPWELRVGDWRVFDDVDAGKGLVVIVAVGRKVHNVLRIGGEEIEL